jgi:predicted pyridoxine 5'-phosphate oxidase superfamily flavin-nucleotide-binding protein
MVFINEFRFNVVDARGVASFLGPAHALKAMTAACSRGAADTTSMLILAGSYDADWALGVRHGLHVFDEHNTNVLSESFHDVGADEGEMRHHPFRVLDADTRRRSMVPARLGLVVFNLKDRRIIQIENRYANLMREDRGRIRHNGRPTRQVFSYALSDAWSILP